MLYNIHATVDRSHTHCVGTVTTALILHTIGADLHHSKYTKSREGRKLNGHMAREGRKLHGHMAAMGHALIPSLLTHNVPLQHNTSCNGLLTAPFHLISSLEQNCCTHLYRHITVVTIH